MATKEPLLIDVGTTIVDLNNLDMATLKRKNDVWNTYLYMKNGSKYKVSMDVIVQLKDWCVQGPKSDCTNLMDIIKQYS